MPLQINYPVFSFQSLVHYMNVQESKLAIVFGDCKMIIPYSCLDKQISVEFHACAFN